MSGPLTFITSCNATSCYVTIPDAGGTITATRICLKRTGSVLLYGETRGFPATAEPPVYQ